MTKLEEIARAIYLTAFDNSASAIKAWDGDGTPDNPGHAKRQDRAYRNYVAKAQVALDMSMAICADIVEGVKLQRHSHPQAEAYALGWERGVWAASRALRAQISTPK